MISSMVNTLGALTMPLTMKRCCAGSMSHQPWWCRSKCRPLGVTMPNSDCSGANDTDAWLVCVRPGLGRRCTLPSYLDGWPYPSVATGCPRPVLWAGSLSMAGSPSPTGRACAPACAEAPPASAAAKAPRMKSRRPRLPSANTVRTPAASRKFSGALRSLPLATLAGEGVRESFAMGLDRYMRNRLCYLRSTALAIGFIPIVAHRAKHAAGASQRNR